MSVLMVEGDASISDMVRDRLAPFGLQVVVAASVATAIHLVENVAYDVVILELALPDGSGLDVLHELRNTGASAHVIVLSEARATVDRALALEKGADDYVVKPFHLRELTARVLAIGRRRDAESEHRLVLGRLSVDLASRRVVFDDRVVELTVKEFDLLAYLAARPGHVFNRPQLLAAVWNSRSEWQQESTVTEHVRRLRAKLEVDPTDPVILRTVRGVGYRLDAVGCGADPRATAPDDSTPGCVVEVDGAIVFVDAAALALLGLTDDGSLLGRALPEFVAARPTTAFRRIVPTPVGVERRSELWDLLRGDGTQVSVEVVSDQIIWHGRPAERSSLSLPAEGPSRLRHHLTGVLSEVAEAVIVTDLHFHIRSWNRAAERLYGWIEDDVLGRHVLDVLHLAGEGGALDEQWAALEREGRWHGEACHAGRDGAAVEVLSTTTLVRDDAGEPVGIVSVNRLLARGATTRTETAEATDIRRGIDAGEFVVHYQPILAFADRTPIGVEALVRWQHPTRGLLNPAAFLETAERSGSIVGLGDLVMHEACHQVARWRAGGADMSLSVNVSARQLCDDGLVESVAGALTASGLDPWALSLEVTESALVEELDKAAQVLRQVVALGVRIAIDDFGTGWASLTYLRCFPVHELKIDRSFVSGAGHNAHDRAIIRSVVSLGAELGLAVVAEGIETEAQERALLDLGCPLGQGHLYGRPVAPADIDARDFVRQHVPDLLTRLGPPARTTLGGVQEATEHIEGAIVAAFVRDLLRTVSTEQATQLFHDAIRSAGGTVAVASEAHRGCLPD